MTEADMESMVAPIENLLNSLSPDKLVVFVTTLKLFAQCCEKDSDMSMVLVVRRPTTGDDWVLNVTSLNATRDDAYEMLDVAFQRVAEDISAEAPTREYLN